MTGYFWQTKDVNAFGAYTPSLGTGLYHLADEKIASGIKLWSYGRGDDSAWSTLSTASHQTYLEIQGGPIGDQSIKLEMRPGETRWHVEYWFPADHELDIYSLLLPRQSLRPFKKFRCLDGPGTMKCRCGMTWLDSFHKRKPLPAPPAVETKFMAAFRHGTS